MHYLVMTTHGSQEVSRAGIDNFFSVKGQIVNSFYFVGHMISLITTQLKSSLRHNNRSEEAWMPSSKA